MAQLSILSAIGVGLFILNPILAPAQEVQYASVIYNEGISAGLNKDVSAEKNFVAFAGQYKSLATKLQQAYAGLESFSYDQRGALTHTFFTQSGQSRHVVFNKNNRPVLEVTTLNTDTYPELLVNTLQHDYPEAEVVTLKHIQSEYGTWYEAVIRDNEALKKVEIIL